MLFIGGIQPKTQIIDRKPRLCPVCGLAQAYYRRVDHYLSLFFIPVFKVKKGEPFLTCDVCQKEVQEMFQAGDFAGDPPSATCSGCGRTLESNFRYCPHCGRALTIGK